jgi:hypothetical protein
VPDERAHHAGKAERAHGVAGGPLQAQVPGVDAPALGQEVGDGGRPLHLDDRLRRVGQAQAAPAHQGLDRRLVHRRVGGDGLEHGTEGDQLSQLGVAGRDLVVQLPQQVHDPSQQGGARVDGDRPAPCHSHPRIVEGGEQCFQRALRQAGVGPDQGDQVRVAHRGQEGGDRRRLPLAPRLLQHAHAGIAARGLPRPRDRAVRAAAGDHGDAVQPHVRALLGEDRA